MKKVGISLFCLQKEFGDEQAIITAKKLGADIVDFSLDKEDKFCFESIYSKDISEIEKYYFDLGELAKKEGVEIHQIHGRGKGFINNSHDDSRLIENAKLDIIASRCLGAKYCVMHTATTIFMGKDAPVKLMHKLNYDMFSRILPFAAKEGIIIATETFGDATGMNCCDFFGNTEEFIKGFEKVYELEEAKDYFRICLDTGHTNKAVRFGNPPVPEVIHMLADKIEVLHLHDNDGIMDRHKIPGAGIMDWREILQALKDINYKGCYNLEIDTDQNHFGKNFMLEELKFGIKAFRNMLNTMTD